MGTEIKAAAIATALGAFAGGAIADAALGLEGAVVGVVSAAAAGLAALLGGVEFKVSHNRGLQRPRVLTSEHQTAGRPMWSSCRRR